MRHPLVQVDIEKAIDTANERLEQLTEEVREANNIAADADSLYSGTFYQIYAETPGSEYLRKAAAKDATRDLYTAKRNAEAVLESAKEAGRNLREQCENLRSLNANVRPQVVR